MVSLHYPQCYWFGYAWWMLLGRLYYLSELWLFMDSRKRFVFQKLWQWTLLCSSHILFTCYLCFLMFFQSLFPLRNISWTVVKMEIYGNFLMKVWQLSTKIAISLKILILLLKNVNPEWISIYTWEEILKYCFIGSVKNVTLFVSGHSGHCM